MNDEPNVIGYVVLSKRPDTRGGFAYDTAGGVWPSLEPVVNHRGWCEDNAAAQAAEHPQRYGDVQYVVGEIRELGGQDDMSERPDRDECDTCGHERWNHGEDEGDCGFGNDCECTSFTDEEREAFLAYMIPLVNDDAGGGG